ncbi:hypothetical protein CAP36_12010 [Chitinophagaceae bacterium IBVUCB2]|nr:hypothetical protein CAP36_12010 [Chitinophagaceae bacterium IBVUCB2]
MKKHSIMMIIGCTVPLLLIFLLPLFGVSRNISIFIFIVLMFGCHFLMIGRHGSHNGHDNSNSDNTNQNKKEDSHVSHQH